MVQLRALPDNSEVSKAVAQVSERSAALRRVATTTTGCVEVEAADVLHEALPVRVLVRLLLLVWLLWLLCV